MQYLVSQPYVVRSAQDVPPPTGWVRGRIGKELVWIPKIDEEHLVPPGTELEMQHFDGCEDPHGLVFKSGIRFRYTAAPSKSRFTLAIVEPAEDGPYFDETV